MFQGGVTAINNFGAGGTNVHAILKGRCKPSNVVLTDAGTAKLAVCVPLFGKRSVTSTCTQVNIGPTAG